MIKFNQISRSFIGDEVETVAIDKMSLTIKEGISIYSRAIRLR
jgi:putative ABC transport system ATP-binding protein